MLFSKLAGENWTKEHDDFEITGICYDSRNVEKGNVFVAINGLVQNGHKYAAMAEKAGAAVIVAEEPVDVNIPVLYVNNTKRAVAEMSDIFFGSPSKKFKLIGVTGTNGKTTTTYLIKSIFEAAGKKIGVIGTNQNIIGDKVLITQSTTPTTPNALELQKLFTEMAEKGAEYVVMEVSSHALDLDRVYGCDFDTCIFTNLTQDHLDFHKTMENYFAAKAKLFTMCKTAVINTDDESGRRIAENAKCDVVTVSIDNPSDIQGNNIRISSDGVTFSINADNKEEEIFLPIPGRFNVYNSLGAIAAALAMGIDIRYIKEGLRRVEGVTGRVEVLDTDTDYKVIIDYAHTPDGIKNIISTVSEFAEGRVITLFGCGGDRDDAKRPVMGEIAGTLSDYCIITSDNPRTENPMKIIRDIETGMKKTDCEYIVIENRKEAIGYALDFAEKGDIVILAGKGQETYQIIGKEKIDFDERVIVHRFLNK